MLTREQLERRVPAAFNLEGPSQAVSDRYKFLPTLPLIEEFERLGFKPVQASQQGARLVGNSKYARHLIRFEHPDITNTTLKALGDSKLQIILDTAHNGTRAHTLMVGIFRLICLNGLTVHTAGSKSRIIHTGSAIDQLKAALNHVTMQLPSITNHILNMQITRIEGGIDTKFARAVLAARFKVEPNEVDSVSVIDVLTPRRNEDSDNTAWCIMNRVQDNLRNGTVRRYDTNNNLRHLNLVSAVTATEDINKIVWQKSELLKAAA